LGGDCPHEAVHSGFVHSLYVVEVNCRISLQSLIDSNNDLAGGLKNSS
jgi:hypothetical protein